MDKKNKRRYGQFNTVANPFRNPPAIKWLAEIEKQNLTVIEPFYGSGNLVKMLPQLNWAGFYDIDPPKLETSKVIKRDTLKMFPKKTESGSIVSAVITNPPWFSRRSANSRKMNFDGSGKFDDLYKDALSECLQSAEWVAAIVPESFIRSKLFTERLQAVVILPYDMFGEETEHAACLALFSPQITGDTEIWIGETFIGRLSEIQLKAQKILGRYSQLDFVYGHPDGEIAIFALDRRTGPTLSFASGESINSSIVKRSSRCITRVKLQFKISGPDLQLLIAMANKVLLELRTVTSDIIFNSSHGRRHDGYPRRRLDFRTATKILNRCIYFLDHRSTD